MSRPSSIRSPRSHLDMVKAHWGELSEYRTHSRVAIIDGRTFSLAAVAAVSRFRVVPEVTAAADVLQDVNAAAATVAQFVAHSALSGAQSMYGTTTGFGSSARTRVTTSVPKLQRVLIQGLQAGITLPPPQNDSEVDGMPLAIGARSLGYVQGAHSAEWPMLLG